MKKIVSIISMLLLYIGASAQGYKNPVLPGFHADPSVCRVGDDFYLVNSTFQYFPGVPVFHSKDLIHWEQIGNCLTRPSQLDLSGLYTQANPELGWTNAGVYATTIREHNGRLYMVTTVFPSRRHFYVWTDNPAGEWSEPIVIDFAIGSCDPTLYFEGNKCYFLWKEGDIKICEIDVETGKQLGDIHHLGTGLGGRYPEGPHIYKKDGYYYLLLAEGGTIQVDMDCRTLPQVQMPADPKREEFNFVKRDVPADSYASLGLAMGWHSIGNPKLSCYSLTERKGWLRLKPTTTTLDKATSPTFVARRQTEKRFTSTTLLDASHMNEGMQAGITAYAAPLNHYDVLVEKKGGNLVVRPNIRLGELAHSAKEMKLKGNKAYLRISSDGAYYYMQMSDDGKTFETLAKMDFRYLSTEVIGGFTGVMLGVFTQGESMKGTADFDWFEYN